MNTTDHLFFLCELLTHSSGQVNIRERASFALLFFFSFIDMSSSFFLLLKTIDNEKVMMKSDLSEQISIRHTLRSLSICIIGMIIGRNINCK